MTTFKILNYYDGAFTTFSLVPLSTPTTGDAVYSGGLYYIVMHKSITEANTYLVAPMFANPPS